MIDLGNYTAESILSGMLSRIPDYLDKREGSIIYDALAPAAYEFSSLYLSILQAFDDSFIATASNEALDMRGAEIGMVRRGSVKAIRTGKFYGVGNAFFNVGIGDRFSTLDGEKSQNFRVFEKVSDGIFHLEAENGGGLCNEYVGQLLPIQYVEGLVYAEITGEPVVLGADVESDEEFRERYFYQIKNEPGNGNVSQYLQWALEYPGIGKAKVFPLWNGVNTVKVSILGTDDMPCSPGVVAAFQKYLDPDVGGLGNGVAPVGAKVTVSTVALCTVNVGVSVEIASGRNREQVKNLVTAAIKKYFDEISYKKSKVHYMEVGAAILSVDGVLSISLLKLNNGVTDIPLGAEQRPSLGTFTMEVLP
ncbi:MAG: baseplate J/gp47 family protein [Clostridiales bacterium]